MSLFCILQVMLMYMKCYLLYIRSSGISVIVVLFLILQPYCVNKVTKLLV